MDKIAINKKGKFKQMICRHEFVEGIVHDTEYIPYFNISGGTYTTICTKCGKIKSTRFIPNFDGS